MRVAAFLAVFFALLLAPSVTAQQPGAPAGAAPAGGGDKNLQIDDAKMRSMELERVKKDAEKPEAKNQPAQQPLPASNFEQIKKDFESIQRLQDDIVAAYSGSKDIDYKRISGDASLMNESAVRLDANLFPPTPVKPDKKKDKKAAEETVAAPTEFTLPPDVKSIIVEQDNTISAFVSNPMFTNAQVFNQNNNAKAHADLLKLVKLSSALQQASSKQIK